MLYARTGVAGSDRLLGVARANSEQGLRLAGDGDTEVVGWLRGLCGDGGN